MNVLDDGVGDAGSVGEAVGEPDRGLAEVGGPLLADGVEPDGAPVDLGSGMVGEGVSERSAGDAGGKMYEFYSMGSCGDGVHVDVGVTAAGAGDDEDRGYPVGVEQVAGEGGSLVGGLDAFHGCVCAGPRTLRI